MKKCNTCNIEKEFTKYHKNNKAKDGLVNKCKTCQTLYQKEYHNKSKNKVKRKETKKKFYNKLENIEKRREYQKEYQAKRLKIDPLFKTTHNIRNLILCCFKLEGWSKTSKTYEILGCNFNTFLTHLKINFTNNYNIEWSDKYLNILCLDHITPIAFAKTEEELILLNHYTNFQFLWEPHNLEKSNKLDWTLTNSHIEEFKRLWR